MASPPSEAAALRRTTCLAGAWQMACDDWLLDQGTASFRLYRWSSPTLSLGHHQRRLEPRWLELARQGRLCLVRRPSGGGAVLHAGGLTYALVWPRPPAARQQAYRQACRWLREAFAQLGQPLRFGSDPAVAGGANCFASSTAADLVHPGGAKRVGSAQLWRRGALLQHGEILLDPPPGLWQAVFATPPPPLPPLGVTAAQLEAALLDAARRALPWGLAGPPLPRRPLLSTPLPWRALELAAIAARLGRYRLDPAADLASPAASIDRTTWGSARPSG